MRAGLSLRGPIRRYVRFRVVGNRCDRGRGAGCDRSQGSAGRPPCHQRLREESAPHGRGVPDPCRRDDARRGSERTSRDSLNQIRNFDFRGTVEKAIDPDGSLRDTMAANPLDPLPSAAAGSGTGEAAANEPAPDENLPEPEPPPPGSRSMRRLSYRPPCNALRGRGRPRCRRRLLSFRRSPCSNVRRRPDAEIHRTHEDSPWPQLRTTRSTTSRCR